MITTAGLHALVGLIGDTDTPVDFTYIAYGSGTTAAAAEDTALGTETQRDLATVKIKSIINHNDTISFTKTFVATSSGTLSEIGVFTLSSSGTMLLRNLPVDPVEYTTGEEITVSANVTVKNLTLGNTVVSSSVANPTVITCSGSVLFSNSDVVNIIGHTGSTPAITGAYTISSVTGATFTIPVNVTVGGTGGTVRLGNGW